MLKISANLDPDDSLKGLSQKLLIHSVGERDYSAQETCHLLQSLPLYHSSRTYVTVNTYNDSASFRVKKRQVGITDGILEINSSIVHAYKHRPITVEFRNVSLLEFATNFKTVKDEIKRRKPGKEAVVIVLPYIQKNDKDPSYCRYMIIFNLWVLTLVYLIFFYHLTTLYSFQPIFIYEQTIQKWRYNGFGFADICEHVRSVYFE